MPDIQQGLYNPEISNQARETGGNLADIKAELQKINSFTPAVYDYIALSYTDSNLTGVVYKIGGASGTTVCTLALAYSGSDLISITKS